MFSALGWRKLRSRFALAADPWRSLLGRYRGHGLRTWLLYAAALVPLLGVAKYDPALLPYLFDVELLAGLASFAAFYVRREVPRLIRQYALSFRGRVMGYRAFRLVLLAM